jgi:hypothetical protein
MRLSQALTELQTSKANLQSLTSLLEASLKANEDLRNYNQQIGQRMQERDEDLYRAYQDIEKLEKKNAAQGRKIIILGFILGIVVLFIGIFVFIKIKTGGIASLLKLFR